MVYSDSMISYTVKISLPSPVPTSYTLSQLPLTVKCMPVTQSCPNLCKPMNCSSPGSSVYGVLQAGILEWVAIPISREIFPTQGLNLDLLHCRWILYQLSHQGSPRILEWVSLTLLQWIFLTQELKRGLLHCRRILYQLSY